MDRRKLQRVALLAGLLFLILLAIGTLLHAAGEAVKAEDQQKLGALVREHPEYEDSYARIMGGDAPNETADLGAQIMEKYGYTPGTAELQGSPPVSFPCRRHSAGGVAAASLAVLLACGPEEGGGRKGASEGEHRGAETQGGGRKGGELVREEQETKSLVTDISHQLKTPIAALRMSLEIKETTELTEEEKKEWSGRELEEVGKLEELLNSFTQLSKLEADMIQIRPRMEEIRGTLAGAVGAVYMKAFRRGIDLSLEESEDRRIPHDPKWTRELLPIFWTMR